METYVEVTFRLQPIKLLLCEGMYPVSHLPQIGDQIKVWDLGSSKFMLVEVLGEFNYYHPKGLSRTYSVKNIEEVE